MFTFRELQFVVCNSDTTPTPSSADGMHVWNYAFTSPYAFLECMQTPVILPLSNTNLNRNDWKFSVQKGSETGVLVYMYIVQRILHPVDTETVLRISFDASFVIFYFLLSL